MSNLGKQESQVWTPERREIATASCLKWHGTPHRDRMAILGTGVDCVQLIHEILVDAGIVERRAFGGYDVRSGLFNKSEKLKAALLVCLNAVEVPVAEAQFGDIIVFVTGGVSAHVGFFDGSHVWHALANKYVTRSQFAGKWRAAAEVAIRIAADGFKADPNTKLT